MRIKTRTMVLLIAALMITTSAMVPDSRVMTPPKEPIVGTLKTAMHRKIETAKYLTSMQTVERMTALEEDEPAPVQEEVNEIVEEVEVDCNDCESEESQENLLIDSEESYESAYEPGLSYIGVYEITAYEWTGNPCANGNYPTEGYTVACNGLPLGTEIYIEGVGYRTVEDRGAEWHGPGWIDLYLGDEASCWEWGVQYLEVYLVD